MTSTLIVTSKTLSLKGQMWVHDENNVLIYNAAKAGVFSRDVLVKDVTTQTVATLSEKRWKVDSPWLIESKLGNFTIKRKPSKIMRHYWIESGQFDGVTVQSQLQDAGYDVLQGDTRLAQTEEKGLSLSGEHRITILEKNDDVTLLATIIAIVLIKDRQHERRSN